MSKLKSGSDQLLKRWRSLYRRVDLDWPHAVLLAAGCVGLAVAVRIGLGAIGATLVFATVFPALLISTLIGGWRAGLLAIPLSISAVWVLLVEPAFTFKPLTAKATSNFVLFTLSSLLVVAVAHVQRRLVFDLEELERERALLAREVFHRSKNQAAVIASLVRRTVSNREEAERLIGRIGAITDTDNLLAPAEAQPLDLHALLEKVVQRPHGDQVQLSGPRIVLSAEQARSLSLAFHEMMTNATKYGGLSSREGKVEIAWSNDADGRRIVWQEYRDASGNAAPDNAGFGLQLIGAALAQIGAVLTVVRLAGGYRYDIVLAA